MFTLVEADPLTINGIQNDTDKLVDDVVIVHFPTEVLSYISTKSDALATGISQLDNLNTYYDAVDFEPLFANTDKDAQSRLAGYYRITFGNKLNLADVIADYQKLEMIDLVEPVPMERMYFTPNDPQLSSQWGLTKIAAEQAWDVCQGNADVIIAIADSGVDWDHPDLASDIWLNTNDPIDDQDNDDNGYVDDYRGWDWVTGVPAWPGEDYSLPDNDPMDFNGHGTHCSGIAAACTDNGVGVAGIGFNCKIMCLRVGWQHSNGEAYVRMDFVAQAFNYAAIMGARAFNCSWGSSLTGYLRDAVDYAISQNIVVVSAAGNENTSSASYLCSRNDVISVAATNHSDGKASFSNYGSWVDVSAPGVGINSTFFNNTYGSHDGTSMAAPFVTGLAGLLIANDPSLYFDEIIDKIISSTDPIYDINPDYVGQLGTGRINAYAALASNTMPNFNIADHQVTITSDDGDNRLNPGETFDLIITLANTWADASGVTAVVHGGDYFTVNNSTANFGDIGHGQQEANTGEPFNLTASSSMYPGDHDVTITVTASGGFEVDLTLTLSVTLNQEDFPVNIPGNIESSPLIYDYDGDGAEEIIVGANDNKLYIIENDGSISTGWPQDVGGYLTTGPAVGDIDNDGAKEVVAVSKNGNVYAWEANGTVMSGFPVALSGTVLGGLTLGDIDDDSDLEIIVGSNSNRGVFVIQPTGGSFDLLYQGTQGWLSGPMTADLDGNGTPEVIYAGSDSLVHAWKANGEELAGFPVQLPRPVYVSTVVGDVDNDEEPEIAAITSAGELYLINASGTIDPDFPAMLNGTVMLAPAMADIDGDLYPEIIIVDNQHHIHAINASGAELSNFPIECPDVIKSSPVIADLNGDGRDIIVGSSYGRIFAFDVSGNMLPNFPIGDVNLADVKGAPAIADLDNDGDLEIAFGLYSAEASNFMVVDYKTHSAITLYDWPNQAYDNLRSGFYDVEGQTNIDEAMNLPMEFALYQNYPNPFNATTNIMFELPDEVPVTIDIYDVLGRNITTIDKGLLPAGGHNVIWQADRYSSGIYFYKITAGDRTDIKRCVLIK
jgi:subtilisin family serine protease